MLCFSHLACACCISLLHHMPFVHPNNTWCRSPWARGLRCGSAAARLLEMQVRIPREARTCVSYECCVLTGRGLCVGLIIRPQKSYRVWCVTLSVVCHTKCENEASMRKLWLTRVLSLGGCITECYKYSIRDSTSEQQYSFIIIKVSHRRHVST